MLRAPVFQRSLVLLLPLLVRRPLSLHKPQVVRLLQLLQRPPLRHLPRQLLSVPLGVLPHAVAHLALFLPVPLHVLADPVRPDALSARLLRPPRRTRHNRRRHNRRAAAGRGLLRPAAAAPPPALAVAAVPVAVLPQQRPRRMLQLLLLLRNQAHAARRDGHGRQRRLDGRRRVGAGGALTQRRRHGGDVAAAISTAAGGSAAGVLRLPVGDLDGDAGKILVGDGGSIGDKHLQLAFDNAAFLIGELASCAKLALDQVLYALAYPLEEGFADLHHWTSPPPAAVVCVQSVLPSFNRFFDEPTPPLPHAELLLLTLHSFFHALLCAPLRGRDTTVQGRSARKWS
eukprot:Rhum_TRINITY_DN13982_c0_g1::Rhum_TRINITY_DN13982_c0_g1_i1::g.66496::m.66496